MANKARGNAPKLVPLKAQALAAIEAAGTRLVTQTRAGSGRRVIMQANINIAWREYRAGNYQAAIAQARTAHI